MLTEDHCRHAAAFGMSRSRLKKLSRREITSMDLVKPCHLLLATHEQLRLRNMARFIAGLTKVFMQQCRYTYGKSNPLATFQKRFLTRGKDDVLLLRAKLRRELTWNSSFQSVTMPNATANTITFTDTDPWLGGYDLHLATSNNVFGDLFSEGVVLAADADDLLQLQAHEAPTVMQDSPLWIDESQDVELMTQDFMPLIDINAGAPNYDYAARLDTEADWAWFANAPHAGEGSQRTDPYSDRERSHSRTRSLTRELPDQTMYIPEIDGVLSDMATDLRPMERPHHRRLLSSSEDPLSPFTEYDAYSLASWGTASVRTEDLSALVPLLDTQEPQEQEQQQLLPRPRRPSRNMFSSDSTTQPIAFYRNREALVTTEEAQRGRAARQSATNIKNMAQRLRQPYITLGQSALQTMWQYSVTAHTNGVNLIGNRVVEYGRDIEQARRIQREPSALFSDEFPLHQFDARHHQDTVTGTFYSRRSVPSSRRASFDRWLPALDAEEIDETWMADFDENLHGYIASHDSEQEMENFLNYARLLVKGDERKVAFDALLSLTNNAVRSEAASTFYRVLVLASRGHVKPVQSPQGSIDIWFPENDTQYPVN
ncbi:uncharacterized protein BYT42DRAFT_616357 [Radiomyces spectabilis]|uniref:uncharacterized protein n=1 Tax=Radiomyces spectabilis TaxID=64574 RepID=UPI0022202446|nr:uncharacterized protein BYT42DRAFT_616357 [Radiomyces spectabilis]KAI8373187.1 hypothetical protein BYT42DRAFT_616357 [Radiomyces spectabilis]